MLFVLFISLRKFCRPYSNCNMFLQTENKRMKISIWILECGLEKFWKSSHPSKSVHIQGKSTERRIVHWLLSIVEHQHEGFFQMLGQIYPISFVQKIWDIFKTLISFVSKMSVQPNIEHTICHRWNRRQKCDVKISKFLLNADTNYDFIWKYIMMVESLPFPLWIWILPIKLSHKVAEQFP